MTAIGTAEQLDGPEACARMAVIERVEFYQGRMSELESKITGTPDPALLPLVNQVSNHLRHVSFGFSIDPKNQDDYPYDLIRTEPYPEEATERATNKAQRLLDIVGGLAETEGIEELADEYNETAKTEQQKVVKAFIRDPMSTYEEFASRRSESNDNEAVFPEFGWTLKGLYYDMVKQPAVLDACEKSPILDRLRKYMIKEVKAKIDENIFGYESTVLMIEDVLAFFDIAVRVNSPNLPDTYHSARFEYNMHSLVKDKRITLLPTATSVDQKDLITIRGVPVAIIGASTSTIQVDGFQQTPYEFFHHDVDHTRRMFEAYLYDLMAIGADEATYARNATELINDKLLPQLEITNDMSDDERDKRMAMLMVLFEILHEDGYGASEYAITDALLREPKSHTPFERISEDGKSIVYYTGPRATTLAHVFRKLAHSFYDLPEDRNDNLGSDLARTRIAIAEAAAELYMLVTDTDNRDDTLSTCQRLVATDEGFTDAFLGNFMHYIKSRARGLDLLRFVVSKPLAEGMAVRNINRALRVGDIDDPNAPRIKLLSLFGYSALEYENPDALDVQAEGDLGNLDPNEWAVAIGATPYGIGRLYKVAKSMGFMTFGIVSQVAVATSEECANGVDKLFVIKDTGWGGARYKTGESGLLAPTTRVFTGASDEVWAYGGGNITALALKEMEKLGKQSIFKPFEQNHQIAKMMAAQRGEAEPANFNGPAYNEAVRLRLI